MGVVLRTGGQLSTVYEIRAPLILKCYADEWRWKQAKEEYVYGLLATHGVGPVPSVVHVDAVHAVTMLSVLPGRPLSEVPLPVAAQRAVYRRIGELLAAVHRIPMPAFGYLTTSILDPVASNVEYVRRQFAKKVAEFESLGGPAEVAAAVRARAAAADFSGCAGAVLCHNDMHEGNVLVSPSGEVTGFVDVENAVAADPMLDLAKTVQYELTGSPEKVAGLFEGYGPLPEGGRERIEVYRLYHAVELWDWFASTGDRKPLPGILADIRRLAGC